MLSQNHSYSRFVLLFLLLFSLANFTIASPVELGDTLAAARTLTHLIPASPIYQSHAIWWMLLLGIFLLLLIVGGSIWLGFFIRRISMALRSNGGLAGVVLLPFLLLLGIPVLYLVVQGIFAAITLIGLGLMGRKEFDDPLSNIMRSQQNIQFLNEKIRQQPERKKR